MNEMTVKLIKDNGNVTVVALLVLVILTLIGISASTTSNTDVLVARNQIPYKQDFYIAEGGQNKEAIKIARGDYPIGNTEDSDIILDESTDEIASGNSYDYRISYKGAFPPPSGYSILHFNRYDYGVKTKIKNTELTINARYYTIGPKQE